MITVEGLQVTIYKAITIHLGNRMRKPESGPRCWIPHTGPWCNTHQLATGLDVTSLLLVGGFFFFLLSLENGSCHSNSPLSFRRTESAVSSLETPSMTASAGKKKRIGEELCRMVALRYSPVILTRRHGAGAI